MAVERDPDVLVLHDTVLEFMGTYDTPTVPERTPIVCPETAPIEFGKPIKVPKDVNVQSKQNTNGQF